VFAQKQFHFQLSKSCGGKKMKKDISSAMMVETDDDAMIMIEEDLSLSRMRFLAVTRTLLNG